MSKKKRKEQLLKDYPNLTRIEGKMGNVIQESYSNLSRIFEDEEVSDELFKEMVIDVINKSDQEKYKQKVLTEIEKCRDRTSLMYFITNIWLKGEHLGSI